MNINELKQQINRVIGVKGDLRVQAWWMNKLLSDILVYCDENGNSSVSDELILDISARIDNIPTFAGTGTGSFVQTKEVETFENKNTNASITDKELKVDALGDNSVVLNGKSHAGAKRSLAHGNGTITLGENSHAEGNSTVAQGENSHAEGLRTTAIGPKSHAEGEYTIASGNSSHAEGGYTTADGPGSHAEGVSTTALGHCSHAEGEQTTAKGANSHAEGYLTKAIGGCSHTEGGWTTTNGQLSHAEGAETEAEGDYSHAEGYLTIAKGEYSHTEGNNTNAQGPYSHAEGIGTKTNPNIGGQHVEGLYNYVETDAIKVIGCGTDDEQRCNAVEVKQNGDVYITGIGGFTGSNSSSSKSVQEVINELVNIINQITISETN